MYLSRYLAPAERPESDNNRLQQAGGSRFDRQGHAEDVAHVPGVGRPVHPELELQRDPGDATQGEVDEEQPAPEPGHPEVELVAGPDIARFHPGDKERQAERQGNKDKMKGGGHAELERAQGENAHPGLLNGECAVRYLPKPNGPGLSTFEILAKPRALT